MKPNLTRKSGFTLIELLVALFIVVGLIAILFPTLSEATRRSKEVNCLANLRQYGNAIFSVVVDHGILPKSSSKEYRNEDKVGYDNMLYPKYLPTMLRCPLATAKDLKKTDAGFHYSGTRGIYNVFPKMQFAAVKKSRDRVVVAIENYGYSQGMYAAVHIYMTAWGVGNVGSNGVTMTKLIEKEGSTRRPQYHGPSSNRGLNTFFLDGHIELFKPTVRDDKVSIENIIYQADEMEKLKG